MQGYVLRSKLSVSAQAQLSTGAWGAACSSGVFTAWNFSLDEHARVSLKTVIGKQARKPMVLDMPVYISHMSFGALSKETKIAMARGSAAAGTG